MNPFQKDYPRFSCKCAVIWRTQGPFITDVRALLGSIRTIIVSMLPLISPLTDGDEDVSSTKPLCTSSQAGWLLQAERGQACSTVLIDGDCIRTHKMSIHASNALAKATNRCHICSKTHHLSPGTKPNGSDTQVHCPRANAKRFTGEEVQTVCPWDTVKCVWIAVLGLHHWINCRKAAVHSVTP